MAGFQNFGQIPDLSGSTTEVALKKIQDYLFLFQEQLHYLFANLGLENLNEGAVSEMKTLFTEELAGKIADEEGRLAQLQLSAESLSLSFCDAEERLTSLKQSVDGISLSVSDKNGKISQVDLASGTLNLKNLVFEVLKENGATVINGGNIQTGTISAVDIRGVNIFGSEITGSVLTSVSDISQVEIDEGKVAFFDAGGSIRCGVLGYDGYGRLVLASEGESVLRIVSANNLSVNAANGKTLFIGSDTGTVQRVDIGNGQSTVSLNGTVLVNGKTIS